MDIYHIVINTQKKFLDTSTNHTAHLNLNSVKSTLIESVRSEKKTKKKTLVTLEI